jgi:hypothetical protein
VAAVPAMWVVAFLIFMENASDEPLSVFRDTDARDQIGGAATIVTLALCWTLDVVGGAIDGELRRACCSGFPC